MVERLNPTKGPYIVKLGAGGEEGMPRTSKRWFLGGTENAEEDLKEALTEIGKLRPGLTFNQLQERANQIFASHNLSKVEP